jgi:aryl sulfotransferase
MPAEAQTKARHAQTPTRDYRTPTMDSSRWDAYAPRADDIIVATYPKCGTTWTQRIVDLLIFQSPAPRQFSAASPWLDATFFAPVESNLATIEAQTHRRYIKSHMPLDAIPVYEGVKVIHTARDGRDACVSMHNHMLGFLPVMGARIAAEADAQGVPPPARLQTPEDPRDFFLQWMATAEAGPNDPAGELPYCEFEQTYWNRRREPWLLMVHFNDLKADLEGEMRRIAAFLEIETPEPLLAELAEAARFETMKRQGEEMLPQLRTAFDNGAERFLNKGVNGRWKDFLTDADLARYEALVKRRLPPALAAWLEGGRLAAGDPRATAD